MNMKTNIDEFSKHTIARSTMTIEDNTHLVVGPELCCIDTEMVRMALH